MAPKAAALPVVDAGLATSAAPAIHAHHDAGARVRLDAVAPGLGNQLGGNEGLVAARLEGFLGGRRILLPEFPADIVRVSTDRLCKLPVLGMGPINLIRLKSVKLAVLPELLRCLPVFGGRLAVSVVPVPGQEDDLIPAIAALGCLATGFCLGLHVAKSGGCCEWW